MNKKQPFHIVSVHLLYVRYKLYIIPLVVFLICILLIVFVIVPQANDFISAQEQIGTIKEENQMLTEKITTLNSIQDSQIDSDTNAVKRALPLQKDYLGILQSIGSSARDSGIGLDDYSFTVGNISTTSATLDAQAPIAITLNIKGPLSASQRFFAFLLTSLPLSSIEEISYSSNVTQAKLLFYYKLPQKGSSSTTFAKLSEKNKKILKDLSDWETRSSGPIVLPSSQNLIPGESTPSAGIASSSAESI